ncbi:MAG: metal ABC transporter permease [Anaerolineae bacterium]|nr:metal ABC transporter permease [Anaerolineae bacterium]RIK19458.1 MAG: manganese ABC transporter permease [Anaerolineae bacterium]
MSFLLDPLQYDFIVRALLAAAVVGVVCSVLGVYIVLRGMAFLGDAMAHTILPGVVVAFLLGWPLAVGALVMGVLTALGIGALTERTSLKEDTAIGVIFAGFFALGVAMLSLRGNYSIDLAHFLFGNLLGVSTSDLILMAALGFVVLALIFLFYKEFLVLSFDPLLAATLRLPARFLNYLLLMLIAVTIVVALQVVGVALMLAILVTPAATASFLTGRLPSMMAVSAAIGVFSGVAGVYASYYLNIASGPAVVLVATAIFLLVLGLSVVRRRAGVATVPARLEAQ